MKLSDTSYGQMSMQRKTSKKNRIDLNEINSKQYSAPLNISIENKRGKSKKTRDEKSAR